MRIGVISDTHIPKLAKEMPKAVYNGLENVDLIVHAGDFVEIALLQRLRGIKKTVAVYGNMDSGEIIGALKPKETFKADGLRIGLIHGWGPPEGLTSRIKAEFLDQKVDCIIFGHSHCPMNEKRNGTLFFNPGSPTDKIFAPYNSYGILEITDNIAGQIITL